MKTYLELEVAPGLEEFLAVELGRLLRGDYAVVVEDGRCELPERFESRVSSCRTLQALYRVAVFPVSRPKALLGDQNFRNLVQFLQRILATSALRGVKTFRVSAAGKDSSVLKRLTDALAKELSLDRDDEDGELLVRLRRGKREESWEVVARLGKRPMSVRSWRVSSYRGAVDGAVAAAMVSASQPSVEDRVLDPCVGSGTLLIERALFGGAANLVGCDLSEEALSAARVNSEAAQVRDRVELISGDSTSLSFEDGSFDVVFANLPWGEAHGERKGLADFYCALLRECSRTTTPQARLVFLTQAVEPFEKAIERSGLFVRKQWKVFQGGFRPTIFLVGAERR